MARIRRSCQWLGSWYRPMGQGRSMPVTRTRISRCPRSQGTGDVPFKSLGWPSSSAEGAAPSQTRSIWLMREGRLEPSFLTFQGPAMRSSPCLTRVSVPKLCLFKPLPRLVSLIFLDTLLLFLCSERKPVPILSPLKETGTSSLGDLPCLGGWAEKNL